METTRIQTVLRLPPELMNRVRRNARKQHRSFNSYVEQLLERETRAGIPVLPKDFAVSEDVRSLGGMDWKRPSPEELAADPKLAYLVERYG